MHLVRFDVARVLGDQIGGDDSVDMPLSCGRTLKDLAQPRHALIGQNLHPQQVGGLSDADGLDAKASWAAVAS